MNGAKFAFCWVIVCLLSLPALEALPCSLCDIAESKRNGPSLFAGQHSARSGQWIEPISGLKINFTNKELIVRYSPRSRTETAVESREKDGKKGPNIMQRIRTFMMMIPVGLQLLQLPMAIASVKMSLLRSILVAKVALFMLFLRTLLTMKHTHENVIIVKSPPKEYHQHYYNPFDDPQDDKPGWLGKAPSWLQ